MHQITPNNPSFPSLSLLSSTSTVAKVLAAFANFARRPVANRYIYIYILATIENKEI